MRTIAQLLHSAQSGDRDAFAELVRRYERATVATAFAVLHDFHRAEDVAQESFVLAYRKLDGIRNASAFGSWLFRLTHRVAIRRRSTSRTEVTVAPESLAMIRAESPAPVETHEALLEGVGRLPDQERVVITLHYLNGHSATEIAAMLERPVGTITKQLSRGVKRLQHMPQVLL